jgi:uncharacterized delta-60 repeat protein
VLVDIPDGNPDNGFTGRLVVQPDGKYLVVGGSQGDISRSKLFATRFNPDGSLDAGFASGGSVIETFGETGAVGLGIGLQSNENIVVSGAAWIASDDSFKPLLGRFGPDGALDATFGNGGFVISGSCLLSLDEVAIIAGNKILALRQDGLSPAFGLNRFLGSAPHSIRGF